MDRIAVFALRGITTLALIFNAWIAFRVIDGWTGLAVAILAMLMLPITVLVMPVLMLFISSSEAGSLSMWPAMAVVAVCEGAVQRIYSRRAPPRLGKGDMERNLTEPTREDLGSILDDPRPLDEILAEMEDKRRANAPAAPAKGSRVIVTVDGDWQIVGIVSALDPEDPSSFQVTTDEGEVFDFTTDEVSIRESAIKTGERAANRSDLFKNPG